MNLSIEKILHAWLVLSIVVLATFTAWVIFGGGARWLQFGADLPAAESNLMRYQIAGERDNGPVAIFSDLEALGAQLEKSFSQSAPDDRMASDGFGGGADYRQEGILVSEVLAERHVDLSVLISQGHSVYRWGAIAAVNLNRFFIDAMPIDYATIRARRDIVHGRQIGNDLSAVQLFGGRLHRIQHTATAHFDVEPGRRVNGGLSQRGVL